MAHNGIGDTLRGPLVGFWTLFELVMKYLSALLIPAQTTETEMNAVL